MTWHIWLALALGYMAGLFTACLLAMSGRESDATERDNEQDTDTARAVLDNDTRR